MEMLSMEATTTVVMKDSPGVARYTRKQSFSGSRISKANLCRDNIAALAESRATLCEKEKSLLESKYEHEINLLKIKMTNEKLKEEALREK
ncbi:hypothetical protein C0J52_06539 [Blattella germanica]|nr:hypothetical protein C0J52_06539 [Blattella germanica]